MMNVGVAYYVNLVTECKEIDVVVVLWKLVIHPI